MKRENFILYSLLLFCAFLPLIKPLGLPLNVNIRVRRWHETIENLPENSIVLIALDYHAQNSDYISSFAAATLHHLFTKDVKVVMVSLINYSLMNYEELIRRVKPEEYGKVYGLDYVFLGYLEDMLNAVKQIAKDFKRTVRVDFKGTLISEIPMLRNINNASNFNLLIVFASYPIFDCWTYVWSKYGVPCILCNMH